MNARIVVALTAALVLSGRGDAQESEAKNAEVEKALAKIAQLGPGVHAIKKDNAGRVISCVVVGQSRISTTLGVAKGLEVARTRARLAAASEFAKWLKEKVKIYQKTEDETVLFLEGSEENDQDALRESGKAVEKTTTRIESIARAQMRGMQVLHVDVNDKDKTCTIVLGWSTENVKAAAEAEKVNSSSSAKNAGAAKGKSNKQIPSKKATSTDASRFLP